ncbi:tRNA (adenosine(37)-N6)-threonylcarbamoyltransferase complex dimerization subunit type 1 TsaB [Hydrogenophaga sp.]|uniref:tRNA (adenosine(37)-N6)-threonylcarbamoyltransferase complex dimerization subunit type 1 TsaB n=1 Tax=Hydrogenophaga sp. TaxID=1904254 RepID=UPI0027173D97|nr:tRNA (adenosine(37)-N6)-threonylcarbamoyltransferase complex dimerization subunit type 1 TsaB [Hydrogenophaga sp.]MDO8903819.1 tRNA (adenosine(37)-N6)-threonylcarbamoyltransferase complex dimerization subunit type 1 TsaB [Hydrogenophaga sp.]
MSLTSDPSPVARCSGQRFLAIESSTDTLSIALGSGAEGDTTWSHTGPGAAQASISLLPQVRDLLDQAGWPLQTLDAVVFARGPGSFTGLRTACAVAQGLAYGAQALGRAGGLPVLPVDTLLALADEARFNVHQAGGTPPQYIVALLDARMSELYVAVYSNHPEGLQEIAPARLCAPQDLDAHLFTCLESSNRMGVPGADPTAPAISAALWAGNAFAAYPELVAGRSMAPLTLLPTAAALLRLAPGLLAKGAAVAAQDALPLYVRDKVAQTTAEREQRRVAASFAPLAGA